MYRMLLACILVAAGLAVVASPAIAANSVPAAATTEGADVGTDPLNPPGDEGGMPPCGPAQDGDIWWWGQWDGYDYEMECTQDYDGQWLGVDWTPKADGGMPHGGFA